MSRLLIVTDIISAHEVIHLADSVRPLALDLLQVLVTTAVWPLR
jgi:hypothetical protein